MVSTKTLSQETLLAQGHLSSSSLGSLHAKPAGKHEILLGREISPASSSATSFLISGRENSLLLSAHVIRMSPPGWSSIILLFEGL